MVNPRVQSLLLRLILFNRWYRLLRPLLRNPPRLRRRRLFQGAFPAAQLGLVLRNGGAARVGARGAEFALGADDELEAGLAVVLPLVAPVGRHARVRPGRLELDEHPAPADRRRHAAAHRTPAAPAEHQRVVAEPRPAEVGVLPFRVRQVREVRQPRLVAVRTGGPAARLVLDVGRSKAPERQRFWGGLFRGGVMTWGWTSHGSFSFVGL